MFGKVNNLPYVRHYEEAHRFFTQATKPSGKAWDYNERPLGTTRQHHYRLVDGDGYYDVKLYQKTMARYHAPEASGGRRVEYDWDSRVTSTGFMYHVCDIGKRGITHIDTEGVERYIPIGSTRGMGTMLYFTADGRLDVQHSWHAKIAQPTMSKEHREWRAEFRSNIKGLCDLMELAVKYTLDSYKVPNNPWACRGCPGDMADISHAAVMALRGFDGDIMHRDKALVLHIKDVYDACAQFLVQSRTRRANVNRKPKPFVQPTPQDVTRSVLAWFMKRPPQHIKRYDDIPLPQFPTKLSSSYVFL